MKNFKYIILFLSCMLVFSCNKDKEKINENNSASKNTNDSLKKADSTIEMSKNFQSFTLPPEIQGCSCTFAKNKEDFENRKFIYADDYGNTAYVKIDNKIVKIPMEEGDFDPSDISKTLTTKEFTITIKGKKLNEVGESIFFTGEMTVEKKDGTKNTSNIYGKCGC